MICSSVVPATFLHRPSKFARNPDIFQHLSATAFFQNTLVSGNFPSVTGFFRYFSDLPDKCGQGGSTVEGWFHAKKSESLHKSFISGILADNLYDLVNGLNFDVFGGALIF